MFSGSMVALITPMTSDGAIDEIALEALVAFHIEKGTTAIVAVGTTGESPTVSHDEHRYVVKRIVDLAAGRIAVIAGTGSNSTQEAIALTQAAKRDGADAALLVAPYYNRPTQEGMYRHFKTIAEAVAIPQIVYNVPGRTSSDVLPQTIGRLSAVTNIIGLKEVTTDPARVTAILDACAGNIEIYSGEDPKTLELMKAGAQGTISVTANVAPALMQAMCQAALQKDYETATAINNRLEPLHHALFLEPSPTPVKWAMAKMGYGQSDGIRLPLLALSTHLQPKVLAAMDAAGVSYH